jgi:iron(III) transport system ATP-binding protein
MNSVKANTGCATAVSVAGLTKHYGDFVALDTVSVDVGERERMVLLGPSGCGKTTLLRCIAGLEIPTSGEIVLNGVTVFSAERGIFVPPERRGISMVFQSYALWPHMTVFDNVAYPLRNRGVKASELNGRVAATLKTVSCDGLEKRYPSQLSGGQQQRVALARAIVSGDKLILFDEPLSNVDAKVRESLRIELIQLQRRLGFAAIYVTHDQSEATAIAEQMVVMNNGVVAQAGTPRDIYSDPASLYVAEFTGVSNRFDGEVVEKDGDLTVVSTSLGRFLSRAATNCSVGSKVKIAFRPENLHVVSEGAGQVNTWQARVESRMFLGSQTEYALRAGDRTLLMRGSADVELTEDSLAWITVQPLHVCVFAVSP